jgi:alpha-ketoglutarate-dependent taurine dioxygenase
MDSYHGLDVSALLRGRKAVTVSAHDLVTSAPFGPDAGLPVVIWPAAGPMDLDAWCAGNRAVIDSHLRSRGAVLFRGFAVLRIEQFEAVVRTIGSDLLEYAYRSTPRTRVGGNIYTSTEYPASQTIPLHNENSYSRTWPLKIGFYCVKPSEHGGETPIADSRKVLAAIDDAVRWRFIEKGVMYVRNYGGGVDLSWQTTFQTDDRDEVERYCGRAGIEYEWRDGGRLQTRQVCPAVREHPETGEAVWFNQAHLFHVSSLDPEIREQLLAEMREEDLPRNACYGDGSPIEASALQAIRAAYHAHTVRFSWEGGDVLMLDNMLCAHGRAPFQGTRQVVVGMAQPYTDTPASQA